MLVLAFTDPVEQHRAALEKLWAGNLCVVEREHSLKALRAMVPQVRDLLDGLGMIVWAIGVRESAAQVVASVDYIPEGSPDILERRFGPGTVLLEAQLERLE